MMYCAAGAIWWRGRSPPAAIAKRWRFSGGGSSATRPNCARHWDDPTRMDRWLWRHVPREKLAEVERQAYAFTREQLALYLAEFNAGAGIGLSRLPLPSIL